RQALGTGGQVQIDAFAQHVGGPGRWLPYGSDLGALLLEAFLDAVREGRAGDPTGEVGRRTTRVGAAAQEAVRTGQPGARAAGRAAPRLSSARQVALEHGREAEGDQLAHRQRRVGADHALASQHQLVDPVEVVGVQAHAAHQDVVQTAQAVDLQQLWDLPPLPDLVLESRTIYWRRHDRGQRIPPRRGVQAPVAALQRLPRLERGQA